MSILPYQTEASSGERQRRENQGAAGAEWGRVWGGMPPSQLTRGASLAPQWVPDRALAGNAFWCTCILIFDGHTTLLLAPTCRCFDQSFMSHWGAKPRFGGNEPIAPT